MVHFPVRINTLAMLLVTSTLMACAEPPATPRSSVFTNGSIPAGSLTETATRSAVAQTLPISAQTIIPTAPATATVLPNPTESLTPTDTPAPANTLAPTPTGTRASTPNAPATATSSSIPTALAAATPTISASARDVVIAAAGDIACDPATNTFKGGQGGATSCHQGAVANLIMGMNPDKVLALGDVQYYCGGYEAFQKSYDLSWGKFKGVTLPVVGNHEYLTQVESNGVGTGCNDANEHAAGYFKYYGPAAGTRGQGYYSVDAGTWHLIALNSNCSEIGGCGSGSPQDRWLLADLAGHPAKCTLAFFHIPLWSSGGRASKNMQRLTQDLYDKDVDVILTGHDHIYERFAAQDPTGKPDAARGIRAFVVGTGGANHTDIADIFPNSEVRNADTFGALKLTLHPAGYDWQFIPETGRPFTDAGSGACH